MLKQWIQRALPKRAGPRDVPMFELAVELLTGPDSPLQLSPDEARVVAAIMQPVRIAQDTVFIREGEEQDNDFLLMVLKGEVIVESIVVSRVTPVTVTVLGPGSMHGEMGLIDGKPRSASCTAATPLVCAKLTRRALSQLMDHNPRVAAKLLVAVSVRISDRLRENTEKLKRYVQLTKTLQQEVDYLLPTREFR